MATDFPPDYYGETSAKSPARNSIKVARHSTSKISILPIPSKCGRCIATTFKMRWLDMRRDSNSNSGYVHDDTSRERPSSRNSSSSSFRPLLLLKVVKQLQTFHHDVSKYILTFSKDLLFTRMAPLLFLASLKKLLEQHHVVLDVLVHTETVQIFA